MLNMCSSSFDFSALNRSISGLPPSTKFISAARQKFMAAGSSKTRQSPYASNPIMDRFLNKRSKTSTNETFSPIEFNPEDLISEPGLRIPIENYDANIRDQVRRAYLIKGPYQPSDSMIVYVEKEVFVGIDNELILQRYQKLFKRRIQLSVV